MEFTIVTLLLSHFIRYDVATSLLFSYLFSYLFVTLLLILGGFNFTYSSTLILIFLKKNFVYMTEILFYFNFDIITK